MDQAAKKKVQQIIALAMEATEQGLAHVFVNYYGHTQSLDVSARPADSNYGDTDHLVHIFNFREYESIHTPESWMKKLDEVVSAIQGLWAESEVPA